MMYVLNLFFLFHRISSGGVNMVIFTCITLCTASNISNAVVYFSMRLLTETIVNYFYKQLNDYFVLLYI